MRTRVQMPAAGRHRLAPFTTRAVPLSSSDDWRLLARALGADGVVTPHQVHGRDVGVIRRGLPRPVERPTCDALVSDGPETAVAIRAADCVSALARRCTDGCRCRGSCRLARCGGRGHWQCHRSAGARVRDKPRTYLRCHRPGDRPLLLRGRQRPRGRVCRCRTRAASDRSMVSLVPGSARELFSRPGKRCAIAASTRPPRRQPRSVGARWRGGGRDSPLRTVHRHASRCLHLLPRGKGASGTDRGRDSAGHATVSSQLGIAATKHAARITSVFW